MKFSPVCPIHIYEALAAKGPEYIGDYFLLLAHDVLLNKDRYNKLFASDALAGATIIMDNSVIELGNACNADNLLEAASVVGADVVVIPDVLENGELTVQAALKFVPEWRKLSAGFYGPRLMFVPQGRSQADYVACFETAFPQIKADIEWIGVARNLVDRIFPTRRLPVGYIDTYLQSQQAHRVKLHMLGYSTNIEDDYATCKIFGHVIEGIDSAVPLRGNNEPRGTWWDNAVFDEDMAERVLRVRKGLGEIA